MPRVGDIYSKPAGTTFTPNTVAESAKVNAAFDDLVQDANTARPIVAGGTGANTAVGANDKINTTSTDIASASTVNLANATGVVVNITGTTTITSLGTVASGALRTLIFGGILTLTHNATSLILPGGANITTAAGDVAQFRSKGSGNWVCVGYQLASGQKVAPWIPVNNGSAVTVDFDTITTPGWHNRLLTDDGTVHGPGVSSRFYYVQVIESAAGNLIQEAYPYRVGTEKKYIRTRFSGSWSAWKQEAYLDDVLPLAGGTMTGKITLDGDASSALHPTTKQQMDAGLALKAGIYTGSTRDETVFPIGHIVFVAGGATRARNDVIPVFANVAGNNDGYSQTATLALSGTWRARGAISGPNFIAQRTA